MPLLKQRKGESDVSRNIRTELSVMNKNPKKVQSKKQAIAIGINMTKKSLYIKKSLSILKSFMKSNSDREDHNSVADSFNTQAKENRSDVLAKPVHGKEGSIIHLGRGYTVHAKNTPDGWVGSLNHPKYKPQSLSGSSRHDIAFQIHERIR